MKKSEELIIISDKGKKLLVADHDVFNPGNWHNVQDIIKKKFIDWRLPNINELELIYEQLHKKGKGNFKDSQYWSGSEESPQHVWYINFDDGYVSDALKMMGANVRLVKDIQLNNQEDEKQQSIRKNRNKKLIAFGDIHGCIGAAQTAIQIAREYNARAVFLGDYVDRGPDSMGTLRVLMDAKEVNPDWLFLRGNHDQMLLDLIHGRRSEGGFDQGTFEETLPLLSSEDSDFQAKVSDFLESTRLFYETDKMIFVHAPLRNNGKELRSKTASELLWNYDKLPQWNGKPFIHGHYNTEFIEFSINNINLNTFCGYDGKLTGLLIDEDKINQFRVFEIDEDGTRLNEFSVNNTVFSHIHKY